MFSLQIKIGKPLLYPRFISQFLVSAPLDSHCYNTFPQIDDFFSSLNVCQFPFYHSQSHTTSLPNLRPGSVLLEKYD